MKINRMNSFTFITMIFILLFVTTACASEEQLEWKEGWPTRINIGAAPIGGGFYMGASSLANVLKEEWPRLEVIVEQTKASVHNIRLTEADEVHFAMATTDTTFEGWVGQGPFEEYGEQKGFRIFMPCWPNTMTFVTLQKTGVNDVREFTGRFSGISLGSATDVYVRKVFNVLNIDAEVVNLPITDSVQALKIGNIQGYSLGHPNTATQELAMTEDIRILTVTDENADVFMEAHPEYTYPLKIEGGYYRGVDEDIYGVGFYNLLICRDDLPEDMIYAVLKAMYKHQDVIESTWPLFSKGMVPENVRFMGAPMHEGSLRYYEEIGAEISDAAFLENW